VNLGKEIINRYNYLHKNKKWKFKLQENMKSDYELYVYNQIRNEILDINSDATYVVDVLVKYLYDEKSSKNKETLWKVFGDILLYNLKENLKKTKQCEICGERIEDYNTKKYCIACAKEKEKVRKREWKRNKASSENQAV
jgi:ribosomal protein L37E